MRDTDEINRIFLLFTVNYKLKFDPVSPSELQAQGLGTNVIQYGGQLTKFRLRKFLSRIGLAQYLFRFIQWLMFLRKILIQLHGNNRTYFYAVNYARIQSFRFKKRKTLVAQRQYGSQNLTLFTNSWIQRLNAENVPEAELSVKFITEHVLGKDRSWVGIVNLTWLGDLNSIISWCRLAGYWRGRGGIMWSCARAGRMKASLQSMTDKCHESFPLNSHYTHQNHQKWFRTHEVLSSSAILCRQEWKLCSLEDAYIRWQWQQSYSLSENSGFISIDNLQSYTLYMGLCDYSSHCYLQAK